MGKFRHGLTRRHRPHHPLYGVWCSMKQRCVRATHPAFRNYGGRGIVVCARWFDDFEAFVADMGPRPSGLTLERIDNDGPYSPENCRWATYADQNRNRAPHFTYMTEGEADAIRQRQRDGAQLANAKRRNPPKICLHCGGEYHRQGYTNPRRAPRYCSRRCYEESRHKQPSA